MTVDEQLVRLARQALRLREGAQSLDEMLVQIDGLLGQVMVGFEYVHPRPLHEQTRHDLDGKRVIEVAYAGYLCVEGRYQLAVKTVKVLERKSAVQREAPGQVLPLLQAPQGLRYAAVDVLAELVQGLAAQVDEVVGAMDRRCASAGALLEQLRSVSQDASTVAPSSEPGQRRRTQPAFSRK